VGVGLESRADGSGRVQATVTLDRDAADQVPDLASQLRVADLARAGWVVTGPLRQADGSVVVRASKSFTSPGQVPAVVAELAGPAGPLRDVRLVQHRGFLVTSTRFSGTADLGPGIEAFGDPQLRQRLGGSSIGVDPAELERQLGIVLAKVVDVRVSLHMAGSGSVHSNAPRGGTEWRIPLGMAAVMQASAHQYRWVRIEIVGGAALVLLVISAVVVTRRVRARRHPTFHVHRHAPHPE
jgi:hypothetical protein